MFNKNRYENSETYQRIENEIKEHIGIEEYQKYKKACRNERIRKYVLISSISAASLSVAFFAGIKSNNTEPREN